ncbi:MULTISPECIES: helix-turn-helix domain-containing protein [unclassified Kitasatospora]|uniref:helix-turn-helix domain-containing protein n=1 Tax=unclassified Kitasatospora TaxID=2633591 RepID=UPI00070E7B02|nr:MULTISPECIES: helix-turn-helix domain-containing protein [unclassified Kitasatospora]KQV15323.1 excisionase [Kitasatospora sp. Root107]KRB64089.1 excisionase [Kitasatospora sp. Root187]
MADAAVTITRRPHRRSEAGPFSVPVLYRVPDAMLILRMSRTVIYDLIRVGRLRTVKEGRARFIPASAIAEYVALLEQEAVTR